MSKHKVPAKWPAEARREKTETAEPTPVSDIYYIEKGFMARLFTDGWHCSCYQADCEHIEAAKVMRKEEKAAAKEEAE